MRRNILRSAWIALSAVLLLALVPITAAAPASDVQQVSQGTPYIVRSGDSWTVIANIFGVSADRLIDFNGLRNRPDILFVGEVIHIPIDVGFTASSTGPFFYTVVAGDSVQSIVDSFEIDKTAFLTANALISDSVALTAGSVLLVPAGPHRVVAAAGETLASIAARYSTTVDRLLLFNPHLASAAALFPGASVFIPIQYNITAASTTSATSTTATVPTSILPAVSIGTKLTSAITAVDGTTEYVVQNGDTWSRIERKFGVSAAILIDLNGLRTRPDLLRVGETIVIPISLGFTPSFVNVFLYLVQAGDTLQGLINTFEIDRSSLLAANGLSSALDNNSPLTAGETLLIPAGTHRTTVKTFETLKIIADRYSTTISNLLRFNSHLEELLLEGQNVFIPTQLDAVFIAAPDLSVPATSTTTSTDSSSTTTTTTTSIADPGGPLTIRWVAVRSVRLDPDFPAEDGKIIATLALEFRGGVAPFTFLHEGVETSYAGPFVRTDNAIEYTDIDFDLKVVCGGPIVASAELRSSDGQTATHPYFVATTCPS